MKHLFWKRVLTGLSLVAVAATAAPALAADAGAKPKMISVATFGVGASGYAELSAVNEAIFKKFGVKIRNVPIGNSVARAIATKSGTTQLWQSCSAYYPAAEGIDDFATREWGPQPLRVFYMSNRAANYSPAATKQSGIKTMAEVKGKRVAWIIGNPAINMQTEAYLAFANLTTKDVKLVEFPGYTASLRGMINGQVDVALAASSSTGSYEIDSSPVGLQWIPIPHGDKEGWKRIQARATFVAPVTVTTGAGIAKGSSIEAGSYPCPVLVAYDKQDPQPGLLDDQDGRGVLGPLQGHPGVRPLLERRPDPEGPPRRALARRRDQVFQGNRQVDPRAAGAPG